MKGNVLMVSAVKKVVTGILANPVRSGLLLRLEFDASSKNFLGVSEGGREVQKSSKFVCFSGHLEFLNRAYASAPSQVPLFFHACKYPSKKSGAVPLNEFGLSVKEVPLKPPVSEAFGVADHIVSEILPMIPHRKGASFVLVCLVSDSWGSTLNTHIYAIHMLYKQTEGEPSIIFFPIRCRIHQSQIASKDLVHLFVRMVGLRVKPFEKKIYLACQTVQVKKEDITSGITRFLNTNLTPVDNNVAQGSDKAVKKLFEKLLMPKDQREDLCVVDDIRGGEMQVERPHYNRFRSAGIRQYAGMKLPVWSRWLTFSSSCRKLLIMLVLWLSLVVSRLFGETIQLKSEECPNVFLEAENPSSGRRMLFKVAYFVARIISAVDRFQSHLFTANENQKYVSRRAALQKFNEWNSETLEALRDVKSTVSELEVIHHTKFGEDEINEAVRLSATARLTVMSLGVVFNYRYGSCRDVHEAFMDDFFDGLESAASLMAKEINIAETGDAGWVSLASVQRYLVQVAKQGKDPEKALLQVMERCSAVHPSTKKVEEYIGRLKRVSKMDRSYRNIMTADTLCNHSHFQSERRRSVLETKINDDVAVEHHPVRKRYASTRGCDVVRGKKMAQKNVDSVEKGQLIDGGVNKYTNDAEKFEARILARQMDYTAAKAHEVAQAKVATAGQDDLSTDDEDEKPKRHPDVTQHEVGFYNDVEKEVRSAWSETGNNNNATLAKLAKACNRIQQPLTNSPMAIGIQTRTITPTELGVCSAVRAMRKRCKQKDAEGDGLEASAVDLGEESIEEEEAMDEDDEDVVEAIFCPMLVILSFQPRVDPVASPDEQVDERLEDWWLIVRTDLVANDFSAIRLERMEDERRPETMRLTGQYMHSLSKLDYLRQKGTRYELFKSSLVIPSTPDSLMLPHEMFVQKQGKISINSKKERKSKQETLKADSSGSRTKLERDFNNALIEKPPKRIRMDDGIQRNLDRETRQNVKELHGDLVVANSKLRELPADDRVAESFGQANASASSSSLKSTLPVSSKVLQKYETERLQREFRMQVDLDIAEMQIDGFHICERSSASTWKAKGVLGDRLLAQNLDSDQALLFVELQQNKTVYNLELHSRAKVQAHSYFKYNEQHTYMQASALANVWCVRCRFILQRVQQYVNSIDHTNGGKEAQVQQEWDSEINALPQRTRVLLDSIVGADRKKRDALCKLDPKLLKVLDPLGE